MRRGKIANLTTLISVGGFAHAADQAAPSPVKLLVDVVMYILERVSCDHLLARRETASPSLSKQDARVYARCPIPAEVEKNLRQKYAPNPVVIHALDGSKSAARKSWTIYPPLGSQSTSEQR
jgi:hypothetical protein